MYPDPKRIRKNRVSINLDDYEDALIKALVDYTGTDRATLVRQMLIAQAETSLLPTQEIMAAASNGCESRTRTF